MLKTVIEDFITHNYSIASFLDRSSDLYQDGKDVIPMFIEKLKETQFSSEIGNSFAELLQLSDDKETYDQFELIDISRLYDSLLKLQETKIDTFIDAGYFEFSVMDNPDKARAIVEAGLNMTKKKAKELEVLLSQIDEESTKGV
jgi:hypothetical protein